MSSKTCARCGFPDQWHPAEMSPAEALAHPAEGPCHRFEAKAPLRLRLRNRL